MVSGSSVIDGDLRTLDVLTVAFWEWTGVSMSLNGPSARRPSMIGRGILKVEVKLLGLPRRKKIELLRRRALQARKITMTVKGWPLEHLPHTYRKTLK